MAVIADKSLVVRAESELAEMTPSEIIAALRKADMVLGYAARVRDAIKTHVEQHGEIVADGVRLHIVEQTRRAIDPLAAWPVLEKLGFGDEDFAKVMRLSISKIEKLIAAKAGKREGAKAIRVLGKILAASDAIQTTTTTKLEEKRA